MPPRSLSKSELRVRFANIVNSLDSQKRSISILNSLLNSKLFLNSKTMMLFASTKSEVNMWPLINSISRYTDKTFYFPFVDLLEVGIVKTIEDFTLGQHSISIPKIASIFPKEGLDLAIIPGLSFDSDGFRLGHGSGWYDKFLNQYKDHIKHTIGLCFKEQLYPSLPHDDFDVKVDQVISD
jgi:5-formyltetrahydrofolate cyclo-ligase